MPRPRVTELRRAQIVAACARVVARDGLDAATIAVVAAEAGLAHGLLHYHFRGKAELVLALVAHATEALEARFEAYGAVEPRARLRAWLDAAAAGAGLDLELAVAARRDPAVAAAWSAAVAARRARLAGLLGDVATAEGRPRRSGDALLAATLGFAALGGAAGHDAVLDALLGPAPSGAPARARDDWAAWK